MLIGSSYLYSSFFGLTENDGHENDGPKMKAGGEVAGEQIEF